MYNYNVNFRQKSNTCVVSKVAFYMLIGLLIPSCQASSYHSLRNSLMLGASMYVNASLESCKHEVRREKSREEKYGYRVCEEAKKDGMLSDNAVRLSTELCYPGSSTSVFDLLDSNFMHYEAGDEFYLPDYVVGLGCKKACNASHVTRKKFLRSLKSFDIIASSLLLMSSIPTAKASNAWVCAACLSVVCAPYAGNLATFGECCAREIYGACSGACS